MKLAKTLVLVVTFLVAVTPALAQDTSATPKKVLRYAFEVAETSLDPAKVNDLYSKMLLPHMFEGLLAYDPLARPPKLRTLTAQALPEHSDDFRVWTIKVRPGIYFADDPAFKGQRRELVAQDYVFAIKRFADPANKSPSWGSLESEGIVGLAELRQQALAQKKPFDYDREIDGVRAVDRYTLRIQLKESRPRFHENLAGGENFGGLAREALEFYGDQAEAHPVGTGPFRLVQWRRSSFIAFERNPDYREMRYEAQPAADDAEGQAILAKLKGRRLPMVDRVEVSIVEEEQPRWLAFVNGEADVAYRVGYQFAPQAMPNGKVAPNLAKKGVRGYPFVESAGNYFFFNMDDPTVGGYTPDKVALRRAIGLGIDGQRIIDYAFSGLGAVAQGPALPHTSAYDPALKTEFSDHDPARALALLDLYGYADRNGDGWREMPDGSPLVLKMASVPQQRDRKIAEVFVKNMKTLGLQVQVQIGQWPENLKQARAGKLQMWWLGGISTAPDTIGSFARLDSRQIGGQNLARVRLPGLDELYDRAQALPDGPERAAIFREAERIAVAYMPYKFTMTRLSLDMAQAHVVGYRRPTFGREWWQFVDIDESLKQR
jgi:peptide/nickel transport system substrate-binding protein